MTTSLPRAAALALALILSPAAHADDAPVDPGIGAEAPAHLPRASAVGGEAVDEPGDGATVETIPFSRFVAMARQGQVKSARIDGERIAIELAEGGEATTTHGGIPPEILSQLIDAGVEIAFDPEDRSLHIIGGLVNLLIGALVIVVIGVMLMRHFSGGGIANRRIRNRHVTTRFEHVAGIDEARDALVEVVEYLKDPKRHDALGARPPRGVLLIGPPGTGKTLLAKAVAGEADVPFFSLSGSEFRETFVGVAPRKMQALFKMARKCAPSIIFIDEIEVLGRRRSESIGSPVQSEEDAVLNQLLVAMDGFQDGGRVVVIAATNRPDALDEALTRPGRFDRRIHVGNPDLRGRRAILEIHAAKIKLGEDVDLDALARRTAGYSGAALESLVNEAAIHAVRRGGEAVDMRDFEVARTIGLLGRERRSLVLTEAERRTVAVHEAGHALVAALHPGSTPIERVTIVPHGGALGVVLREPDANQFLATRGRLLADLAVAQGGRAAELIAFGEDGVTTGASGDFQAATNVARRMVTEWGMTADPNSDLRHGWADLGQLSETGVSNGLRARIEDEIARLLREAHARADALLRRHAEAHAKLVEALLEKETLEAAEVLDIIAAHPPAGDAVEAAAAARE